MRLINPLFSCTNRYTACLQTSVRTELCTNKVNDANLWVRDSTDGNWYSLFQNASTNNWLYNEIDNKPPQSLRTRIFLLHDNSRRIRRDKFNRKRPILNRLEHRSPWSQISNTNSLVYFFVLIERAMYTFAMESRVRANISAYECRRRKFKEYQKRKSKNSANGQSTKDKSYRRSCTSSAGESRRAAPRGARVPRASTACCTPRMRRTQMCSVLRLDISSAAMRSPETQIIESIYHRSSSKDPKFVFRRQRTIGKFVSPCELSPEERRARSLS